MKILWKSCQTIGRTMGLRQRLSGCLNNVSQFRSIQVASENTLDVDLDDDTGICTLIMKNKPVNTLSMDLLTELRDWAQDLHSMPECKAVIFTSNERVFSAGLDIHELIKAKSDSERFRQYWNTLLDFAIQLYSMRPITVAAINASAPAGGCMLALGCDYRIMADGKYVIGLNEPQLGVEVPFWLTEMFVNTVGSGEAMRMLPYGKLYSVQGALDVKLIDEVCPLTELMDKSKRFIMEGLKIKEVARYMTKMYIRQSSIHRFREGRDIDTDHKVEFFSRDDVNKRLISYMESLGKK